MQIHRLKSVIVLLLGSCVLGCLGGDAPPLYEAGGVVTYKGEPVKNASVSFSGADGFKVPLAEGLTDEKGQYRLKTRGEPGAAAGSYVVTVTKLEGADEAAAAAAAASVDPKSMTPEQAMAKMAEDMKKMTPDTSKAQSDPTGRSNVANKPKSLIPEKYGTVKFSGLTANVSKGDPANTKLDLNLQD
ncbi:MAG: hypothetical protein ACK5TO_15100 [Planctomycetaceae bacterium]